MKNFFKLYFILWIILALIFNVVSFATAGDIGEFYRYNTDFFVPIILVDIFFILQLSLTYLSICNFNEKDKNNFESLAVFIKSIFFLITLLLTCVVVQIFPVIPKWINPITAFSVLIINFIFISKNNNAIKNFIIKIRGFFCKRIVKFIAIPVTLVLCIATFLIFTVFIPSYKYNKAIHLANNGNLSAACSEFHAIVNYKDSYQQISEIVKNNPSLSIYTAKIGDTVKYGSYEQDGDVENGKEEMEWTVIDIKNNRLFLINNYCIENIAYNDEFADITWEECSLREWLNSEFLNTAFTDEESAKIVATRLSNQKNPSFRVPKGGKNTTDRVFVLSYYEAKFYLKSDDMIHVKATEYVKQKHAHFNAETGNAWWWLRTPGSANTSAITNHFTKQYSTIGAQINHSSYTVRPCIWIQL